MSVSRRLILTATLAAAVGCGKRGDPLPPVRVVPQPVSEFRIAQRGATIEVSGLGPSATTTGARLPVLDLELQRAAGPGDFDRLAAKAVRKLAPGEAFLEIEPVPAPGTLVRAAATAAVGGRASRRTSVLSLTTWAPLAPPTGLTASLTAEGVTLRWVPAPAQPSPPPVAPDGTAPRAGATAPPPAGLPAAGQTPTPGAPPGMAQSPAAATAPPAIAGPPASPTPGAPGVDTAPSPAPAGSPAPAAASPFAARPPAPGASVPASPAPSPTPLPAGFWVYRRARDGAYGRPLKPELAAGATYLDTAVQPGQEWCYSVRFAAQLAPPVESDASNEACVGVRDIAAPAAPAGLALIQGPQGVEISWIPNTEPDLAGYRVYRAVEPSTVEEAVVRAEVAKETTVFRDGELAAGLVHAYCVVAVDAAGNESPRSEILQVRP